MAEWLPRTEWIRTQPQALIASCVFMLDERDRVLMLRYGAGQPAAGTWWLPGGMLDHGEDPWTAARREMLEETGIALGPVPALLGIDHRADVLGTGPVLDCFFDGGILSDDATVRLSDEHDDHALFSMAELAATPLAAHLPSLAALYSAARSGTFAYLREGKPV
ncbi:MULTISPECIES: NUDIX hydrolase [unclassified Streptomyces]|uniref:NUDIX hydrolase n=1 Tax=unclassified Streptomyces TaxID=2593676 RepID=UPI003438A837